MGFLLLPSPAASAPRGSALKATGDSNPPRARDLHDPFPAVGVVIGALCKSADATVLDLAAGVTLFSWRLRATPVGTMCTTEYSINRLVHGMSEQDVTPLMGVPDSVDPCGSIGGKPNGFVREYPYSS